MSAAFVLELLKVLLSGPVVAGAIALVVILKFEDGLRSVISRIAHIKFPGGELSTPQQPPEALPKSSDVPSLPAGEQPLLPAALTDEQITIIKDLFESERARAYVWEYRYLNLFLVPITQEVLAWFGGLGQRTTVTTADAIWATRIPDLEQRRTIVGVLESHHLVQREGELLSITPKGREYLEWKNKL